MRAFISASLIGLALIVVGCKSAEEKKLEAEIEYPTPLNLDPTEEYRLSEWWSNGAQLLRLQDDGGFVMYDHLNRYSRPIERGRWSKMSYAVLTLEPYSAKNTHAIRVSVDKIDGHIGLHVGDLPVFFGIEQPPVVIEDQLLGGWSGSGGTLSLHADRRYIYRPPTSGNNVPASLGGLEGTWSLSGQTITLRPDSPTIKPVILTMRTSDQRTVLDSAGGSFERTATTTQPE